MTEDAIARLLREAGPRPSVAEDRSERVRVAVREKWLETSRARRRRRYLIACGSLASAAVVLLMVRPGFRSDLPAPANPTVEVGAVDAAGGALLVADGDGARQLAVGDVVFTDSVLQTDQSGRAALRLASGGSLRLDFDTRLSLSDADGFRLERGAVYVDSGHDAVDGPVLAIETSLGVARDIGTQFEVRLRDGEMIVRVREGLVELAHQERVDEAAAGVEIRLAADGALARHTILPYAPQWSWASRVGSSFALEGRTLEDFLDWVVRERGWTPRFADDAVAAAASTILLEGPVLTAASEAALRTVLPTCGLSHRLENGELWIVDLESRR